MSRKHFEDIEVEIERDRDDFEVEEDLELNHDHDHDHDHNHDHNHCRKGNLCEKFARILRSTILVSQDGLCAVTRTRNLNIEIADRPTRSPLVLSALFSFESMDRHGNTLNLGETVVLQSEANPFISALRERGLNVTAFHNHWLFDKPRTMYIHWFSIEPPLEFARKVAEAFRVLHDRC